MEFMNLNLLQHSEHELCFNLFSYTGTKYGMQASICDASSKAWIVAVLIRQNRVSRFPSSLGTACTVVDK